MTDAISSILSQIRAHEMRMRDIAADAAPTTAVPGTLGGPAQAPGATNGFSQTLSNAIDNVSRTQQSANELQQAFELGDPKADLARVMVACSSRRSPSAPRSRSATGW